MSEDARIRSILVTGATGGIGKAVTLELSKRGHNVIATGRDATQLFELQGAIRDQGRDVRICELDVTSEASVAEVVADLQSSGVVVDTLVHAAGVAELGPLMVTAEPALDRHFRVNVRGVMNVTRGFLPMLRQSGHARIVHLGGVVDRLTLATHGAYGSSAYALRALNDCLRQELGREGIEVTLVETGTVRTNFVDQAFSGLEAKRTQGSRWNPVIDRLGQLRGAVKWIGIAPERAAELVVRAVVAPRAKRRYWAPTVSSALQLGAKRFLPTATFDAIVRRGLGLRAPSATKVGAHRFALVTGAAGRIGAPTCEALLRAGFRVVAVDSNEVALKALQERTGQRIEVRTVDVTSPRSIGDLLRSLGNEVPDLLVNAAGVVEAGPLEHVTDEEWRRAFEVNVIGVMRVTRGLAERMMNAGGGTIINVSSVAGVMAFPLLGVYQATKFAVEALSDALRQELESFGVNVVLVEPSFIADGFSERVRSALSKNDEAMTRWQGVHARLDDIEKRLEYLGGDAREVAAMIVQIAQSRRPEARYAAPWTAALATRAEPWIPAPVSDRLMKELFHL